LNFAKLKKYTIRMAIAEQRLNEFINNNRSQREGISELVNTLNRIIKQTKKSRINRTGKNDIIKKLTKGMSKLVLITTQAVTEKVTTTIRQMPIYTTKNSTPFSKQTGR
jgi:ribosomal protein L7Ae-like RNA K-turn-binding protein